MPTRILVVDDSALYRQSIRNVLRSFEDVQVVGVAKNGVDALVQIEALDPDLLTLDIQMPDMDGIQLLREIKRKKLRPKAIVVSSLTSEGAQATTEALMEGAFDFVLKPASADPESNRRQLSDQLRGKINTFHEASGNASATADVLSREQTKVVDTSIQAIVLGISTGGPAALKVVLPKLPSDLSVPVLIVQHMPPGYTSSLAKRLDAISPLEVVEATDGMKATAGRVIIAEGGKQMGIQSSGENLLVRLAKRPAEHGVCPSVDYLLRSVVQEIGGECLAVIMTGMGRDGLEGCRLLKASGGQVFVQDKSDCVVYGMPKAIFDAGLADRSLPLGKVAPAILRHLKRSRRQTGK